VRRGARIKRTPTYCPTDSFTSDRRVCSLASETQRPVGPDLDGPFLCPVALAGLCVFLRTRTRICSKDLHVCATGLTRPQCAETASN